jgi:DNA polymerase I
MKILIVLTQTEHAQDVIKLLKKLLDSFSGDCDLITSNSFNGYDTTGYDLVIYFGHPEVPLYSAYWLDDGTRLLSLPQITDSTLLNWHSIEIAIEAAISQNIAVQPEAPSFVYLSDLTQIKPNTIFLDIETTGLDPRKDTIRLFVLSDGTNNWIVLPENITGSFLCKHKFILHNGKFDAQFIYNEYGVWIDIYSDTMLMSYLYDETGGRHSLDFLATNFLGYPDYTNALGKKPDYANVDLNLLAQYAAWDIQATGDLYKFFLKRISNFDTLSFLLKAQYALMRMEYNGIKVNLKKIDDYISELTDALEVALNSLPIALNANSSQQVKAYFKNEGITIHDSSAATLAQLDHPVAKLIVQTRQIKKLLGTYVKPLLDLKDSEDRIHSSFMLHGTVTGRLASSKPNLQNLPRESEVRRMFTPREGYTFIGLDYSQAELRTMAILAQETNMQDIFLSGQDIHQLTADNLKIDRQIAKTINFGIAYGINSKSLTDRFGIEVTQAQKIVDDFFELNPNIAKFLFSQHYKAKQGKALETVTGRKRHLGYVTKNVEWRVLNQAGNFEIQATASDCTLQSLIDIQEYIEEMYLDWYLVLTVHDSIYVEVPEEDAEFALKMCKKIMVRSAKKIVGDYVPFEADGKIQKDVK